MYDYNEARPLPLAAPIECERGTLHIVREM